ncbi:hypothetical protein AHAS_Ahas10G0079600 [Arachis hypogaea]
MPSLASVTPSTVSHVSTSNNSVAAVSHVLRLRDPCVRRLRSTNVAAFSITVSNVHTPDIRLGVHPMFKQ